MPHPVRTPDHSGLTAADARALRDEVQALRLGSSIQADLTALAIETVRRQDLRIAELEYEVGAWERRYRELVEETRSLLRAQAAIHVPLKHPIDPAATF